MQRRRSPVLRTPDGRALVNLGSSARVADGWNNVDFSLLVRLGRYPAFCRLLHRTGLLSDDRYARIRKLSGKLVVWDLRRGIPYGDETFDVVYHSHLLEHIDREQAPTFLHECLRVLKPGGRIRIVVPDFELLARNYLRVLDEAEAGQTSVIARHEPAVAAMIDQMVPRTPRERRQRPALIRLLEHILVGDTARNGTLHRWMYDRVSLCELLTGVGFTAVATWSADDSGIAGWNEFGLDREADGRPYKPNSLYVEGVRPERPLAS